MKVINLLLKLFFALTVFLGSGQLLAQTEDTIATDSTSITEKKWRFGCGFGLNFVGGTNISISPNLTYSVSEKVSFGIGAQYSYVSLKDLRNTSTIGGNLGTLYRPSKKIVTLLELAQLYVTTKNETPEGEVKDTFWDTALFVGAGFFITNKIVVGAKYNLLYDEDESVYTSPVIPFVNITF